VRCPKTKAKDWRRSSGAIILRSPPSPEQMFAQSSRPSSIPSRSHKVEALLTMITRFSSDTAMRAIAILYRLYDTTEPVLGSLLEVNKQICKTNNL